MEKNNSMPAVAWLRVTDYLTGWLQSELGGNAMIQEQKVICVQHLPGVKEVMKMESADDTLDKKGLDCSMSATRHNCIRTGLQVCEKETKELYGITKEQILLFLPIECPRMCVNMNGVLRPWTLRVTFSHEQSAALLKILRQEFWKAVEKFDRQYATEQEGRSYTAKEMIEAFCVATSTSDVYLDTIRREWQRRIKRIKN